MTKQDAVVAVHLKRQMQDRLIEHCIDKHRQGSPENRNLKWMELIGNNAGQKSFETQSRRTETIA